MRTKTLVEGILYVSGNNHLVRQCFEICHVINDTDRNWQSKPHIELFYLDYFKRPYFLMIVDKQLHVYIIGDEAKGRSYNIINIEGYSGNHMTMAKGALKKMIYDDAVAEKDLYLPPSFSQRIIFIKPSYDKGQILDEDIYAFNRQEIKGHLFYKSTWSIGPDIYSVSQPEYETNAHEILNAIFEEF